MINHYETLEISPKASEEVIRAVYQVLRQRYGIESLNNSAHGQKLTEINLAYGVLSDLEKRQAYDYELVAYNAARANPDNVDHFLIEDDDDEDADSNTSILARVKWKKWGWALSILAVLAILISMVRPDPKKALRGQLAVEMQAQKDRNKLEAELKNNR